MNKENWLATLVWLSLIFTIVFLASSLVAFGLDGMAARLPPVDWTDVLFANAFFLFVIGATDYPGTIRKVPVLRTQLCCWSVLMLATAFLFMPRFRPVLQEGIGYLASTVLMIALYATGAMYRSLRKRVN